MKIKCPECHNRLKEKEKLSATDCISLYCQKCDLRFYYYNRTRELIKYVPRIKA